MTALPLAFVVPVIDAGEFALVPPNLENPDATPGANAGIRPLNLYHRSLGYILNASRLICIPVPWATDEANVAYPAGALLVFGSASSTLDPAGYGYVVPDTLPVGYTALTAPCVRGDQSNAEVAGTDYNFGQFGIGPRNWRFILDVNNPAVSGIARSIIGARASSFSLGRYINTQMGTPALSNGDDSESDDLTRPPINFWVGDALKTSTYQSLAYGWMCKKAQAALFNASGVPSSGEIPLDQSYYGPGWRNIRVYFNGEPFGAGYLTDHVIDSITARVYLDGLLFDTVVHTGPFTDESYFDITDVYPATATAQANVVVTLEIASSDLAGPGAFDVTAQLTVFFSPRCDIPLPFTVVGPDNEVAPGGYLPDFLTDPPFNGPDTVHNDAGVTDCELTPTEGDLTISESFCATFIPPTTGMWRIVSSLNSDNDAVGDITIGEHDLGIARQISGSLGSVLCRGGKRMTGHLASYASDLPLTWTLTEVPQVVTAIPSGPGLEIDTSRLTDLAWFFGTIAIPAAGAYRITVTYPLATFQPNKLLLCVSLTDPYVADYLATTHKVGNANPTTAGTFTLDVGMAAAATLYVRFGRYSQFREEPNPSVGSFYPTITWAAL